MIHLRHHPHAMIAALLLALAAPLSAATSEEDAALAGALREAYRNHLKREMHTLDLALRDERDARAQVLRDTRDAARRDAQANADNRIKGYTRALALRRDRLQKLDETPAALVLKLPHRSQPVYPDDAPIPPLVVPPNTIPPKTGRLGEALTRLGLINPDTLPTAPAASEHDWELLFLAHALETDLQPVGRASRVAVLVARADTLAGVERAVLRHAYVNDIEVGGERLAQFPQDPGAGTWGWYDVPKTTTDHRDATMVHPLSPARLSIAVPMTPDDAASYTRAGDVTLTPAELRDAIERAGTAASPVHAVILTARPVVVAQDRTLGVQTIHVSTVYPNGRLDAHYGSQPQKVTVQATLGVLNWSVDRVAPSAPAP